MFITARRLALAIIAGVGVAVLCSYAVLVVFVLTTVGIPLGAESRPLTLTGSAILLVAAAGCAAAGARTAGRIARERSRWAVGGVSMFLAMMMLWGFGGRNSWPAGWGAAVAVAMAAGCFVSEAVRDRRMSHQAQTGGR